MEAGIESSTTVDADYLVIGNHRAEVRHADFGERIKKKGRNRMLG